MVLGGTHEGSVRAEFSKAFPSESTLYLKCNFNLVFQFRQNRLTRKKDEDVLL